MTRSDLWLAKIGLTPLRLACRVCVASFFQYFFAQTHVFFLNGVTTSVVAALL